MSIVTQELSDLNELLKRDVEANRLKKVKALLNERPAAIRWPVEHFGNPLLFWATTSAMATLLLERGADPNERGEYGRSALHHYAETERVAPMRAVIKAGGELNPVDDDGLTPLCYACRPSALSSELSKTLLDAGADYGIIAAATRGDVMRVEELLSRNHDAAAQRDGMQMLFAASDGAGTDAEQLRILQLVLASGIRISKERLEYVLRILRSTNRPPERIATIEGYAATQFGTGS